MNMNEDGSGEILKAEHFYIFYSHGFGLLCPLVRSQFILIAKIFE